MASKNTTPVCSVSSMFLSFSLLCILGVSLFLFSNTTHQPKSSPFSPTLSHATHVISADSIKVYVADLPRSLNYGLLEKYWSLESDSRLGSEVDNEIRSTRLWKNHQYPPYPESPLIKQYSAEYWIMGDLMTPEEVRSGSFARRVFDAGDADVVFVPFFATASAELQLGVAKGAFRKKVGNEDYERQRQVVDFVKKTEAWKGSGGRDHVFVLTGYVKT